eukprot:364837-Chlamydomonas_euryale.AAC.11
MAALVFKLGALVLRTVAKPLGNRFQAYIMDHPTARVYAIGAAQVGRARTTHHEAARAIHRLAACATHQSMFHQSEHVPPIRACATHQSMFHQLEHVPKTSTYATN